jgi:hypothetical protein
MLTAPQLAVRFDLPYRRIFYLIRTGVLVPDAIAGQFSLFDERKLTRVLPILKKHCAVALPSISSK